MRQPWPTGIAARSGSGTTSVDFDAKSSALPPHASELNPPATRTRKARRPSGRASGSGSSSVMDRSLADADYRTLSPAGHALGSAARQGERMPGFTIVNLLEIDD